MDSLKQIADLARGLLKSADVGKEYTMEYVVSRLDGALDEYPNDPVIRSVAQVLNKQSKNGKLTTSQKELYEVYNHFAGLSANSMIKEAVGDILYVYDSAPKASISNQTEYSYRPNTEELSFNIAHNPLENLFDKKIEAGIYYDPTLAKIGKQTLLDELNSIGIPATDIKVVAGVGDNVAIVYDAIFTNKLGTAHIPMFIEVKDGTTPPTHFYCNNQFIQLTAENLNKAIVEKAQIENDIANVKMTGIRTSSSIISSNFAFEEDAPAAITLDRVPMPPALKDFASFAEEALIDASTAFGPELVRTAKALCSRELSNMGFKAQVMLSESTDNCLICSAELDSSLGKVEIKLPVEIINDRPQIPALFYNETDKDKIFDFTKAELSNYLTAAKTDNGRILRYSADFFNMTFNQLKEEMLNGVSKKDYVRAEQALNRIEDKFGSELHLAALSDYAKYLSYASVDKEEVPQAKCKLLLTKGSIEPRCGHYNVPISRVATNTRGDCELIERKAKYDNLAESTGTLMRSNKITLT